jgi:hypothetical protein
LRALRVAVDPVQLPLPDVAEPRPAERWWSLPDNVRSDVLALLARLIARGVLINSSESLECGDE